MHFCDRVLVRRLFPPTKPITTARMCAYVCAVFIHSLTPNRSLVFVASGEKKLFTSIEMKNANRNFDLFPSCGRDAIFVLHSFGSCRLSRNDKFINYRIYSLFNSFYARLFVFSLLFLHSRKYVCRPTRLCIYLTHLLISRTHFSVATYLFSLHSPSLLF